VVIQGVKHSLCWDAHCRRPLPWRAWDEPRDRRERAYVEIWRQLRDLADAQRQESMAMLRAMLGPVDCQGSRSMNAIELTRFASSRLVDIGAHTASHPRLTTLLPQARCRQIRASREACRALTGGTIPGFAYPYGDMDERTREDVVASGFEWACSTQNGPVTISSDRFALPRRGVADWEVADFAAAIAG
jgi:peptidoglycan/xylan/chitin deacetylase (PgdA/CDA1 family)